MTSFTEINSIIESTSIQFHNDSIEYPLEIFNNTESDYKFGIIDIKIRPELPIINKHIHMFFTIDTSGSMGDICIDGRTKMDYIHHTLENMLRIFHETNECVISIHIQSFDSTVKTIISNIPDIREADIDKIIYLSKRIRPGGSTNMEEALKKAKIEITQYHIQNPEDEIIHIFLTDGDITDGSNNYDLLLDLVPRDCTNVFIGYGNTHDSNLLSHLSSSKDNDYRFIDALEKAGLVYGEIIHGILYKALEDVTLVASKSELYDYQKNIWVSKLQIGNLLSDQSKIFHIRSKFIEDCNVSIYAKNFNQEVTLIKPNHLLIDLSIYIFRQKTQELLYQARKHSEKFKKNNTSFNSLYPFDEILDNDNNLEALQEENKNLKQKLNEFHKHILNFIHEKHLENNSLLKMLCDDIYISYKTIGTSIGTMYTCARQTSNGRQQTYMCSAIGTEDLNNTIYPQRLSLKRQTNAPRLNFSLSSQTQVFRVDEEEEDINNYTPSQDFLSPFSTDSVLTLMREVSGNYTIGRIYSTDEEELTVMN